MVAAVGGFRRASAIAMARPQPHPDYRVPGKGADMAHQHHRAVDAAELFETGGEIGDLHGAAGAVVEDGAQDRGVGQIFLGAVGKILDLDLVEAARLPGDVAVEQGAEDGIGVEPGQAGPDHPRLLVDEGGIAAIADEGEIKVTHGGFTVCNRHGL